MSRARDKRSELPTKDEIAEINSALAEINCTNFLQRMGLVLCGKQNFAPRTPLPEKGEAFPPNWRETRARTETEQRDERTAAVSEMCDKHRATCQRFHIALRVVAGESMMSEGNRTATRFLQALAETVPDGDTPNHPTSPEISRLAEDLVQMAARLDAPALTFKGESMIAIDIPEVKEWEALIEGIVAQSPLGAESEIFIVKLAECFKSQIEMIANSNCGDIWARDELDPYLGFLSAFERTAQKVLSVVPLDTERKALLDDCRPVLDFFCGALKGKYFNAALQSLHSGILPGSSFLEDVQKQLATLATEKEEYQSLELLTELLSQAVNAYECLPSNLPIVKEQCRPTLENALQLCEQHLLAQLGENVYRKLRQLIVELRERIN